MPSGRLTLRVLRRPGGPLDHEQQQQQPSPSIDPLHPSTAQHLCCCSLEGCASSLFFSPAPDMSDNNSNKHVLYVAAGLAGAAMVAFAIGSVGSALGGGLDNLAAAHCQLQAAGGRVCCRGHQGGRGRPGGRHGADCRHPRFPGPAQHTCGCCAGAPLYGSGGRRGTTCAGLVVAAL